MAEKETEHEPKDVVEPVPEEVEKLEEAIEKTEKKEEVEKTEERKLTFRERRAQREAEAKKQALDAWAPKTELGKRVKEGKEKDLDKVLEKEKKILESEIVDLLLPGIETDLISIGQAKGKFGGGKRRAWRQTQKKTQEGNVISFSCMATVGDKKGHVGLGYGKAKETLPSREKAFRKAKLNITKINLGFETAEPEGHDPHTIPFAVEGKSGSVKLKLKPAPRGTGLVVADECKKILRLAGIKDVYGKVKGHTKTTFNLAKACFKALTKTTKMKL
jgi:small subunit ribosomal protein S5